MAVQAEIAAGRRWGWAGVDGTPGGRVVALGGAAEAFSAPPACCLLLPVPRQELGSESDVQTHCLLLGDLRVKQAKIMLPP